MAIKSQKDLENLLLPKMMKAIVNAREKSFEMVKQRADDFYGDYTPIPEDHGGYHRTYQLNNQSNENFIQRQPVEPHGKGYVTSVGLEVDALSYATGKPPSGEQVVSAAVEGKHGALGDGLYYVPGRTGVKLWDESMQPKGMEFLIEELKAQGIPIK